MTNTPEWVKTAKVGDKVQCTRAEFIGFIDSPLTEGRVYTIDGFQVEPASGFDGQIAILVGFFLQEAINPFNQFSAAFDARRFRPLTARPTDISVFSDMLIKAPAKENA